MVEKECFICHKHFEISEYNVSRGGGRYCSNKCKWQFMSTDGIYKIKDQRLDKNRNWRGGRIIDSRGYIQVRQEGHPRATKLGHYVREHVLVMEKHIGRYLTDKEVVHHINGNISDNRITNLVITTNSDHSRLHRLMDHSVKQNAARKKKKH